MMHETDNNEIEGKRGVVKRDGRFYFTDSGEELTADDMDQGGIFAGFALQGTYQTRDQGVLKAVYQSYEEANQLYFSDSLPETMKGDFGTTLSFIKDDMTRRWVTKFISPYLDNSGMIGMLIRAITTAMSEGMLDGVFGGGGDNPSGVSSAEQEFKDNISALTDSEQKQLLGVLEDLKVTAQEKEDLAAAVGNDLSQYDIDYGQMRIALTNAGKDPASFDEIISVLRGSDGLGNTAVDLDFTTDPAKANEYRKALRETAEVLAPVPSK